MEAKPDNAAGRPLTAEEVFQPWELDGRSRYDCLPDRAWLLTPLARFAFTGPAPLFLVDANIRAAGKGLLLHVIAKIVTGEPFTIATYTHDEDELRKLGVELKDHNTGLIDFPCRMGDREVYLCWRLGEPEVGYWHEVNAGFAGRQKLPAGGVARV